MRRPEELFATGRPFEWMIDGRLDDGAEFLIPAAAAPGARRGQGPMAVIASWGMGWDHVSASFAATTPSWRQMNWLRAMFFRPDETVMQLHPADRDYVNHHPHCLHLWRPQAGEIPTPPRDLV